MIRGTKSWRGFREPPGLALARWASARAESSRALAVAPPASPKRAKLIGPLSAWHVGGDHGRSLRSRPRVRIQPHAPV